MLERQSPLFKAGFGTAYEQLILFRLCNHTLTWINCVQYTQDPGLCQCLLANLSCRWGLGLDWGLEMSCDLASVRGLHPFGWYSYQYLYVQLNMGHYDCISWYLEMEPCVLALGMSQAQSL